MKASLPLEEKSKLRQKLGKHITNDIVLRARCHERAAGNSRVPQPSCDKGRSSPKGQRAEGGLVYMPGIFQQWEVEAEGLKLALRRESLCWSPTGWVMAQ